jgi:integrative and conjugative element protein (TIGR02256 family)
LNVTVQQLSIESSVGIAVSAYDVNLKEQILHCKKLPEILEYEVGSYRIRIASKLFNEARGWVKQNSRRRTSTHETGGLLWGMWDDAIKTIWLYDLSGPPSDSLHAPAHFMCGTSGTIQEHEARVKKTHGVTGFVGYWHTHPDIPSEQSMTDIEAMASLVSSVGHNQRRAIMLIFGRTKGRSTAGVYVYENMGKMEGLNVIIAKNIQIELPIQVI